MTLFTDGFGSIGQFVQIDGGIDGAQGPKLEASEARSVFRGQRAGFNFAASTTRVKHRKGLFAIISFCRKRNERPKFARFRRHDNHGDQKFTERSVASNFAGGRKTNFGLFAFADDAANDDPRSTLEKRLHSSRCPARPRTADAGFNGLVEAKTVEREPRHRLTYVRNATKKREFHATFSYFFITFSY